MRWANMRLQAGVCGSTHILRDGGRAHRKVTDTDDKTHSNILLDIFRPCGSPFFANSMTFLCVFAYSTTCMCHTSSVFHPEYNCLHLTDPNGPATAFCLCLCLCYWEKSITAALSVEWQIELHKNNQVEDNDLWSLESRISRVKLTDCRIRHRRENDSQRARPCLHSRSNF